MRTPPRVIPKLGFLDSLKLRIFGYAYIGQFQEESWKGTLPHYIAKCGKCGIQIMRVRGSGWLQCPVCLHAHVYFVGLNHYNV